MERVFLKCEVEKSDNKLLSDYIAGIEFKGYRRNTYARINLDIVIPCSIIDIDFKKDNVFFTVLIKDYGIKQVNFLEIDATEEKEKYSMCFLQH